LRSAEVKARYNLRFGSVPFFGGTVGGEMRELCDTVLSPLDNSESFLHQCLPWKFRKLGYRTIGVHGYSKRMFDREHWYPRIGFQELIFKEELSTKLKTICGSTFPGICDTDIAAYIGDLFAAHRSQRLFVHWMTLNSHLPVSDETAAGSQLSCGQFAATRNSREVCNMVRVQFETNQAIARLLLRPDIPPMTVFMVGDHAPPFLSLKLRALYSQERVPYLIFESKP
jgi:phosphoglycerol transferase MdoB-like AlkP superfamily enzyme